MLQKHVETLVNSINHSASMICVVDKSIWPLGFLFLFCPFVWYFCKLSLLLFQLFPVSFLIMMHYSPKGLAYFKANKEKEGQDKTKQIIVIL